jgi:hypothetical protein
LREAARWVDCTAIQVERVDPPELRGALIHSLDHGSGGPLETAWTSDT